MPLCFVAICFADKPQRHEKTQRKKIMSELEISEQGYNYSPLSEKEERIGKGIVEAVFRVNKELGPGLLEKVYEV